MGCKTPRGDSEGPAYEYGRCPFSSWCGIVKLLVRLVDLLVTACVKRLMPLAMCSCVFYQPGLSWVGDRSMRNREMDMQIFGNANLATLIPC